MKIWYFDKDGFHHNQNEKNNRVEITDQEKELIFKELSESNKILILDQDRVTGRPVLLDPYRDEEPQKDLLRRKRFGECFTVINRGTAWYNTLTEDQKIELQQWYEDWLAVTETKNIPEKPYWLK